jgi:hypothetical protein
LETKLMFVPGVELVAEQHHGKALTSELLRRQATSPGSAAPENPVRRVFD